MKRQDFNSTKNFKKTKIQLHKTTMDVFPPEIVMHIFNQFESLDDLRSCYNTCTKWKQIIEDYMLGMQSPEKKSRSKKPRNNSH